jgi:hypothetical protein
MKRLYVLTLSGLLAVWSCSSDTTPARDGGKKDTRPKADKLVDAPPQHSEAQPDLPRPDGPIPDRPIYDSPRPDAPADSGRPDGPVADAPKADAPKHVDAHKTDALKADALQADAPRADALKADMKRDSKPDSKPDSKADMKPDTLKADGGVPSWHTIDIGAGNINLSAVWASAANNVWVVGEGGTVKRYDGSQWSSPTGVPTGVYNAVWGFPPNDVWVAGTGGKLLQCTATACVQHATGLTTESLNGIWGAAANDIWVVGSTATVLHYDGAWSVETTVPWGGITPNLYGVSGSSASDVWVSGSRTNSGGTVVAGVVVRRNGAPLAWSNPTDVGTSKLNSIWVVSQSDAWTVSAAGKVWRWNSAQWTDVTTAIPGLSANPAALTAVRGTSSTDVWVVGTRPSNASVVFHGTTWSDVTPTPVPPSLFGVWPITPTNVWAVGNHVSGSPVTVLHYSP